MSGKLDDFQREAVITEKSSVVTAGAGSGKTTVLAERFVHLIEEGRAAVNGILTLTFTRKAAAEMYERIYRLLAGRLEAIESVESGPEITAGTVGFKTQQETHQRDRLREALGDFASARISTIDSFCAQVVRGGSGRFGIPGDFVQDDHAVAKLIEETALSFLLEHMDEPALSVYIADHGFSIVLEQLFIPIAVDEFHLAGKREFAQEYRRQRDHLEKTARTAASYFEMQRRAVLDISGRSKWFFRTREKLTALPDIDLEMKKGVPALGEILRGLVLDLKGATSKNEEDQRAKEIVKDMREGLDRFLSVIDILTMAEYEGMYRLLAEYEELVRRRRRAQGVLTFRDVVEMTVVLLSEDLDLRRYYKRTFSHIMIDEFQDNNDLQRRLLYLLAEKSDREHVDGVPPAEDLEPGKLFFVGDEKQSIYRFRGADVSVFTGLQREVARNEGTALFLRYNYRSHPRLIDFFNRFFAGFLADPVMREDFEAAYSPLVAFRKAGRLKARTTLLYKPFVKERNEEMLEAGDAEAWQVAKTIRRIVQEEKLLVFDGGKERPCRFEDIAVLMRSTGRQLRYESFFRRLQIPYTVESTRSLFMEAPVNDIYLALQLLVYPGDAAAYAGLLRSPFVNLSDETAFSLLCGFSAPFSHSGDEEDFAADADRKKYLRAKELFSRLEELKGRETIPGLIRFLWYEWGYRYFLLSRRDYHIYLEFYDSLTALARLAEKRGESLAGFLDFLRRNRGKNEKIDEIELPPSDEGGVQIMTIHRAKGLEFPIVFLVDMGSVGGARGSRLYMKDEELGTALIWRFAEAKAAKRKDYFSDRFEKAEAARRLAELKRLLYVACTRAKDHLYLSGIHHQKNRNVENQGAEALLNIALFALGWNGNADEIDYASLGIDVEEIGEIEQSEVERAGGGRKSDPLGRLRKIYDEAPEIHLPLRRIFFTPVELGRLHWERTAAETTDSNAVGPGYDPEPAEQREGTEGQNLGRALQALPVDGFLEGEDEITAFGSYCHRLIEAKLKGEEVGSLPAELAAKSEGKRKIIEETGEKLSLDFLATPLGREAREADFESEVSFILRVDDEEGSGSFIRGQIDLLLPGPDRVRVIDFKTDRFLDPRHHEGQLAIYRSAAAELYRLPAESCLVYLRGMEIVKVEGGPDPQLLCRELAGG